MKKVFLVVLVILAGIFSTNIKADEIPGKIIIEFKNYDFSHAPGVQSFGISKKGNKLHSFIRLPDRIESELIGDEKNVLRIRLLRYGSVYGYKKISKIDSLRYGYSYFIDTQHPYSWVSMEDMHNGKIQINSSSGGLANYYRDPKNIVKEIGDGFNVIIYTSTKTKPPSIWLPKILLKITPISFLSSKKRLLKEVPFL